MDSHYQPLYKQAAALQYKFHDYTRATAHDPTAMVLRNQLHNLTNDIAAGKNPRTIENRMKTIQTQIKRQQMYNPAAPLQSTQAPGQAIRTGESQILNTNQANYMNKNFQTMRMNIRQHPHY